jgi:hypothetical protein
VRSLFNGGLGGTSVARGLAMLALLATWWVACSIRQAIV